MDLTNLKPLDVRPHMTPERQALCDLLASLSDEEWNRPSLATGWTVKGLALHILDDDLGWLSRGRDGDDAGRLVIDDHNRFVDALAAKNQRWIDGAHGLSRPVVVGLLDWAGTQMDTYYATMDPHGHGRVDWASEGAVPLWFDIAQDFTERWVHQMQIRESVKRVDDYRDKYLPLVLNTFIWAIPHQFRESAPEGTTIAVTLDGAGVWSLTCGPQSRWVLSREGTPNPDAAATFDADTGWRWFTGYPLTPTDFEWTGPAHLRDPLLRVRGILT